MADARPEFCCGSCGRWHDPPLCDHNMSAPCLDCGKPRGLRFSARDGLAYSPAWRCFFCAWGYPRPSAKEAA